MNTLADIFLGYRITPRSDGGWNVYLRDQHIYAHDNKDEAKRWVRAYRNGAMWAIDDAFAD